MILYFDEDASSAIFDSIRKYKTNNPNHINKEESCSDFLYEVAPGIGLGVEKEAERENSYSKSIQNFLSAAMFETEEQGLDELKFFYRSSSINKNNMSLPGWFKGEELNEVIEVYGKAMTIIGKKNIQQVQSPIKGLHNSFFSNEAIELPKETIHQKDFSSQRDSHKKGINI